MTSPLANIDDQIVPLADVKISVLDRGFLCGDAIYEVLRVYGQAPDRLLWVVVRACAGRNS